jgi:beta-N-acetylhexosaminidase
MAARPVYPAALTEFPPRPGTLTYPGLGAAEADTHTGDADLTRSLVELEVEMFEELCATTIGHALLFSHATVRQWDREPVSLSAEAVRRVRRAVPDALIVTDDLQMAPIRNRYETLAAALRAVAAGVDLLCIGNNLTHEEQECFAAAEAVEEHAARDPVFSRAAVASQQRIRERKTVAQRGRLPE